MGSCITTIECKLAISSDDKRTRLRRQVIDIAPAHVQAHCARLVVSEDNPDLFAHSPTCDHAPGQVSHHLQVVLGASSNALRPKSEFFRYAAAEPNSDARH